MKQNRVTRGIVLTLACIAVIACGGREGDRTNDAKKKVAQATVPRVKGSVMLTRGETTRPLVANETLYAGDVVTTGKAGVAIVTLGDDVGTMEVQRESVYVVHDYTKDETVIEAKQGSIWTSFNPVKKGSVVKVLTPSSLAAVKGTTFYTFTLGDIHGTCFCSGDVAYTRSDTGHEGTHGSDHFAITRGDTTVIITPEDLREAGLPIQHDHSELPDSELGKQPTTEYMRSLLLFFNKKLNERENK